MISSTDQIQILYEISLIIGEGSNLKQAASKALSVYLRKLNCSAGAILFQRNINERYWFQLLYSIPSQISRNQIYQEITRQIGKSPLHCNDCLSKIEFPSITQHSDSSYSYLMKLPDFGLLLMIKKGDPLPIDFIYSLRQLNKKLADALKSFVVKEQLDIHSAALEASPNSVLITDHLGNIEWANTAWCQLNQFSLNEVIGKYSNLLKSPATNDDVFKEMWDKLINGNTWSGHLTNKKKDNSDYIAEMSITPIFDNNNMISHYIAISQDITSKRLSEMKLRDNEALLSTLVGTIPDLVWLKDNDGKYLACNAKFESFFGAKESEILGKTDFDFVSHDEAEFFRMHDRKVLDSKIPSVNEETVAFASDGHIEHLETIKTPMLNDNGEVMGVLGIARDITLRKKADEALKESKQRFEDLANLLPQPIWESDLQGRLIYLNKAGRQIFGISEQQLNEDFYFHNIFPEQYKSQVDTLFSGKLKKLSMPLEMECRNASGELFPVLVYTNLSHIHENSNSIRGIILDVSNLKKVENELLSLSTLQKVLIKISTQYINVSINKIDESINIALSEIGEFVQADRAYIFNYNHETRTASNTYEWCQVGVDPQIENLQNISFDDIPLWIDSHLKGDTIYISNVGQLIDVDIREILESQNIKSLIAVPMMHGDLSVGFVGFDSVKKYHDYSENEKSTLEVFAQVLVNFQLRTNTELDLKNAKEKAEKAEKAQFNFLSTMSHEIRTPMNAVVGLSNILLMDNPKESQIENLKILKLSSQNLLNIINDILDYNKLISGNIALETASFNVYDTIKGVYLAMNTLAENRGIKLKYYISSDVPKIVIGDSTRLTQILNNLVSNSIKFTKKGSVDIEIRPVFRTHVKVQLHVSVSDTGIGIPADKFKDIFEEFKQSSSSITREFGGTGLGLPIVKRLLKEMGSDIYLESEVGKGSVFSFNLELPLGDDSLILDQDEEVVFDDSLYRMRVLVVEDNKINQMVVHRFLTEWKCIIEMADNGQIAVEKVKSKKYDVVLMDLHMPVLDGYSATKEIRSIEDPEKRGIPIVALSASALGEIEVRARKFGMDAFVTKPFVPKVLFKTLLKFRPRS